MRWSVITTSDGTCIGVVFGFESGFIYQILTATNAGFSVKQQGVGINYKNYPVMWNHNNLRLGDYQESLLVILVIC